MIGIKRALIRVRLNLPTYHFVCKLNIFRNIVGMSMRYDNLFKKSTITNALKMKKNAYYSHQTQVAESNQG